MSTKQKETGIENLSRDEIAQKYNGLVHKIANQFIGRLPSTAEDIISYAQEGLVLAMNKYKAGGSQTFTQFAAWQMRYNILTKNNYEGYLVKYTPYQQKKNKETDGRGVYIESITDENADAKVGSTDIYSYDSVQRNSERMKMLYKEIESRFSQRDSDIFYRFYGLHGYDEEKGIDIARRYKISPTNVSLINKKIREYIRDNPHLIDDILD